MKAPEIAYISSVKVENGTVKLDVMTSRPGGSRSGVPLVKPFTGGLITPKQGDPVQLYELDDGELFAMAPMGKHYVNNAEVVLPALGENEMCFRFDDGTEIRIQKGASGYDVNISASGSLTVNATGDVDVTATGNVNLGGTGGAPVARAGDGVTVDPATGVGTIDTRTSNVNST